MRCSFRHLVACRFFYFYRVEYFQAGDVCFFIYVYVGWFFSNFGNQMFGRFPNISKAEHRCMDVVFVGYHRLLR